jgi:hypothetical protein
MARLSDFNPINNSDFLLTIEGLTSGGTPVYWTEFSGIKSKRKDAEFNDGLTNTILYTEGGTTSYENVTLAKPYDPDMDEQLFDWITANKNGTSFSFRLRPVKRLNSGANTIEFRGKKAWEISGRLIGFMFAEGINTSDGAATTKLQIEFRVENAELK